MFNDQKASKEAMLAVDTKNKTYNANIVTVILNYVSTINVEKSQGVVYKRD